MAAVRARLSALVLRTKAVLLRSRARLRPLLPDIRDVHVYGGGLLVAWGAWMAWPPAAPAVLGALMVYLGLRAGVKR